MCILFHTAICCLGLEHFGLGLGLGLETGGLGLGLDTCGLGLGLEGSVLNISQDRPCIWPSICFLLFLQIKNDSIIIIKKCLTIISSYFSFLSKSTHE